MFYNSKFYLIQLPTGAITGRVVSSDDKLLKMINVSSVTSERYHAYTGIDDFSSVTPFDPLSTTIVPLTSVSFAVEIKTLPEPKKVKGNEADTINQSSSRGQDKPSAVAKKKTRKPSTAAKPMTMD